MPVISFRRAWESTNYTELQCNASVHKWVKHQSFIREKSQMQISIYRILCTVINNQIVCYLLPPIASVLPAVVDRLGNGKDQVSSFTALTLKEHVC